jgi:aldehyde dehydrogenase (NAD+)
MDNPTALQIKNVYDTQRVFFDKGLTRSFRFRIDSLRKLHENIIKLEKEITDALHSDLGKASYDSYISEIGVTLSELTYCIKNLSEWMAPVTIPTPIAIQPASSKIYNDPKGIVAIFAPWNYPFNLAIIPLVGAVAAGNCVMLKVASETPATSAVLEKLIAMTFDPFHVSLLQGEGRVVGEIMFDHCEFNHVFFTGSQTVGKWIMSQAAKTLTPVTLELGGKSPTIVDKSADIDIAVRRIAWAKFANLGQTCIAPDYILVHQDVKAVFIEKMIARVKSVYGEDAQTSPLLSKLVNQTRFQKVSSYLRDGEVLHGGGTNSSLSVIEPTIMMISDPDSPIMKEEIFGPIMPILVWKDEQDLLSIIRKNRYPLSCYVYTSDRKLEKFVIDHIEFGSGCVNDSMAHFANHHMPFGGIQSSGMGKYHGKYSFLTFSNQKPMLKTWTIIDMPLRYFPFSTWKWKLAKMFLR